MIKAIILNTVSVKIEAKLTERPLNRLFILNGLSVTVASAQLCFWVMLPCPLLSLADSHTVPVLMAVMLVRNK